MTKDEIEEGLRQGWLGEDTTTFELRAGHSLTLDSVLEGVMVRPGEWKVTYSGDYRATVNNTDLYNGYSINISTDKDATELSVDVTLVEET